MMNHKLLIFMLFTLVIATPSNAQFYHDFTAVTPTGQTLYYTIHGSNVTIVNPYNTEGGAGYVSGDMIIPDSVQYIFENDSITTIIDDTIIINDTIIDIYIEIIPGDTIIIDGDTSIIDADTIIWSNDTIYWIDTIIEFHDSIVYYQDTNTYAVTSLYYSAFRYCDSLTSVVIPNTVTNIPYCAFGDCTRLESVTIGNSVNNIGPWAFSGCFALRSLYVPTSVTTISSSAFNAVRHIEYYGEAIGAPWSAISMNGYKDGDFAFADDSKRNLIAYIGAGGSVIIPETDTVSYGAFFVCRSLTSVTVPATVSVIGSSAFSDCSNLATVTMLGDMAPALGENGFAGNALDRVFNIPCGSYSSYSSTWADSDLLTALLEPEVDIAVTVQSADPTMGTAYIVPQNSHDVACDSSVVIHAVANAGYQFDHWSTGGTSNPDTLTVSSNTVITAYFVSEGGSEGVEVPWTEDVPACITVIDGRIHVNMGGIPVDGFHVYDMMGREVFYSTYSNVTSALPGGVYLVKVGSLPARRVVLIR